MFKDNKFTVMAGGKEIICDVLFTFQSQETGKHYMAFTDHSKDREGNPSVFYATYDPDAEDISLTPIQSQQEWMMVRELMNGMMESTMEQIQKRMNSVRQEMEQAAEKTEE